MSQELSALADEAEILSRLSPTPPIYPPDCELNGSECHHWRGATRQRNTCAHRCRFSLIIVAGAMLFWISLSNALFWYAAAQVYRDYALMQNVTAQADSFLPIARQTLLPFQALAATIALHQNDVDNAIVAFPQVERNVQKLVDLANELAGELLLHRAHSKSANQHIDRSYRSETIANSNAPQTLPVWTDEQID